MMMVAIVEIQLSIRNSHFEHKLKFGIGHQIVKKNSGRELEQGVSIAHIEQSDTAETAKNLRFTKLGIVNTLCGIRSRETRKRATTR